MNPVEQVVIPCGGRGERLWPATGDLPRILVPVAGKTLLEHLLCDLSRSGAREVILLAGWGADLVAKEARRLAPPGLIVETVVENAPRGTAGALRSVSDRLAERFTLVLGDIYTSMDYSRLAEAAESNGDLATLLVHRSSHPEDSDRLVLDESDRVTGWWGKNGTGTEEPTSRDPLTNSGVAVFHRDLVAAVPAQEPSDLFAQVLPALVESGAVVYGYRSSEYVRDLGTPQRLESVNRDVERGVTRLKAELVLLDRDGTLNEEVGLLSRPELLRLIPGAAAGLARLNRAGIRVALTSNQPVVARGLCDLAALESIHSKLSALLESEGAHLDGLYFCPHHPETHHPEGNPALRGPCECRKPAVGMAQKALEDLDAQPGRTVVIGDRTADIQMAHNAGLAAIGLQTGAACADGRYPARPVWRFENLDSAARWLCGNGT